MTKLRFTAKGNRFALGAGRRRRSVAERDANVIPMIDVAFILILYFMLAGSLDQELIPALLPPQSASTLEPPQKAGRIVVMRDGKLFYEDLAVDDAGLERILRGLAEPPARMALHADAGADAARVADVIAIVKRAGVDELALITRTASAEPALR